MANKRPTGPSRETDEIIVEGIRLRCAGYKMHEAAARLGVKTLWLNVATNRVKKADVELCGSDVEEHYW